MFNWRAVVASAVCFSTAATFWISFSVVLVARLFISRKTFHAIDTWMFDQSQRMVLFFYHNLWGGKLTLYGDVDALLTQKENVMFISNHQTALDWVVAEMLAALQGDIGKIRYVLKDQIRMLPLFGSYFRAHGCVYVKRGKTRREGIFDEPYVVRQFERLRADEVPLWLVIFPEGTRYNPHKRNEIERSQAFARANGLTVCEEVLTPRSKAVHLALRSLGSHLDAVYDFTIAFTSTLPKRSSTARNGATPDASQESNSSNETSNGAVSESPRRGAPGMFSVFKYPSDIHIHVKRIPISELPDPSLGEEVVRQWLHDRFVLKEQLLKNFLYGNEKTRGRLGDDGVEMRIPLGRTALSAAMWFVANSFFLFFPIGRVVYLAGSTAAIALGYAYVFITG